MKVHYSGGLIIDGKNSWTGWRRIYLQGWACCVTGDRAWAIRSRGNYTTNPTEVTCTTCLRNIKRAGIYPKNFEEERNVSNV